MRGAVALVVACAVSLGWASAAIAQDEPDPEEFTPSGYKFCGWKDLATGGWKMQWDESLSGAFLTAFAEGMTCRDARRAVTRTRTRSTPPYAPYRKGYRCVRLRSEYEFSDVRCTKLGGKRKYRFQTGS